MKVVAVGTINRDTLIYPDGSRVESLGGLLYSLVALAHLLPEGWTLVPIANVGRDLYDEVLFKLSRYPNVLLEGLHRVEEKNNHVVLTVHDEEDKREVLRGGVPPVYLSQVQPTLEDAGLVLLNFTSGFDLPFQTVRALADGYRGLIMMDFHSLSLGRDRRGNRFPRVLPNWTDWVGQVDIFQLNRAEAALLLGRPIQEAADAKELARKVLLGRPRLMVLTLGEHGSYVLQRKGRGVSCVHVPGENMPAPVYTTGCGDLFGAAFAVRTLEGSAAVEAARWATHLAALKCRVRDIEKLDVLLEDIRGHGRRN